MKMRLLRTAKPVVYLVEQTLGVQIVRVPPKWRGSREQRPTRLSHVEVLQDRGFREAVDAALPFTLLDTPRLANLWQLARESEPGLMIELGVFRGGGSVLLSRACPDRHMVLADTFESFGERHSNKPEDRIFYKDQFKNTNASAVESLMKRNSRNFTILQGYFPESDSQGVVRDVSFAHLDFDLYDSTIQSLLYLASHATPRAVFVLDDFRRCAEGVDKAVSEFVASHPEWRCFPLYPGQGLLVRNGGRTW